MDPANVFVLKVLFFLLGCVSCVGFAASKSRNVYAWGFAGAAMPPLVLLLAFLKPLKRAEPARVSSVAFPPPRNVYR